MLKNRIIETLSKIDEAGNPINRWGVDVKDFDLDRINVCNTGKSTHS